MGSVSKYLLVAISIYSAAATATTEGVSCGFAHTLSDCLSQAHGNMLIIGRPYDVDTDIEIDNDVKFEGEGMLEVAEGRTATISGQVDAATDRQIFQGRGKTV